jgi:hypothetical protein
MKTLRRDTSAPLDSRGRLSLHEQRPYMKLGGRMRPPLHEHLQRVAFEEVDQFDDEDDDDH